MNREHCDWSDESRFVIHHADGCLEMECSNWTMPRVKSLKLCWSGSRNMMLNSSECPGHLTHQISIRSNTFGMSWDGNSEFNDPKFTISQICVTVA
ncbi:hypothetical protein TNCV_2171801 [Trichonephila clavipes]|nr:hypothetical protein TNCV_2171801 [Trichonephila clavipes]